MAERRGTERNGEPRNAERRSEERNTGEERRDAERQRFEGDERRSAVRRANERRVEERNAGEANIEERRQRVDTTMQRDLKFVVREMPSSDSLIGTQKATTADQWDWISSACSALPMGLMSLAAVAVQKPAKVA